MAIDARKRHALLYAPSRLLMTAAVIVLLIPLAIQVLPLATRLFDHGPMARPAPPTVGTAAPLASAVTAPPAESGNAGTAQACLAPITRGGSSFDLCWQAYRQVAEEDPNSDTYTLEIGATAHGGPDGIRWATVEADVSTGTADNSYGFSNLRPDACTAITAAAGTFQPARRVVLACEHWQMQEILEVPVPTRVRTAWDCAGCVLPVTGDRDVSLLAVVNVPQGALPTWRIGVDLGR